MTRIETPAFSPVSRPTLQITVPEHITVSVMLLLLSVFAREDLRDPIIGRGLLLAA